MNWKMFGKALLLFGGSGVAAVGIYWLLNFLGAINPYYAVITLVLLFIIVPSVAVGIITR